MRVEYLGHAREAVVEHELAREMCAPLDDCAPVRGVVERWAEVHLIERERERERVRVRECV